MKKNDAVKNTVEKAVEKTVENAVENVVENTVKMIPLEQIQITERIRKDNGDITTLAESIREHGQINPITVMAKADGRYVLIAGLRRMEAIRMLEQNEVSALILSPMEADEALMMEYAENEERKSFTLSERLKYAEMIREVEKDKANQRMLSGKSLNDSDPVANRPQGNDKGKTRDIVARKAGFTSQQQMKRVEKLAEKRPDLLEAVDAGKLTVGGAERKMKQDSAKQSQKAVVESVIPVVESVIPAARPAEIVDVVVEEKPVEIEVYRAFKPHMIQSEGNVRTIKGADHDHLLENPIYKQLFESYNDAVQQVNLARGEMRTRCEGYERKIRAYEENLLALHNEIVRLKGERHA